jgi:hypothetical protein
MLGDGDLAKQRDDLLYADIVDVWVNIIDLDNWVNWSYGFLWGDAPTISVEFDKKLENLQIWLLGRVWPKRYPELEDAFHNFRRILQDFQLTFHEYSEERSDELSLRTRKFYKSDDWLSEEEYSKGIDRYQFHLDLLEDLMLELTRAANYICDLVRKYISPVFRLNEGRVLVRTGLFPDLRERTIVAQYQQVECTSQPYPGLQEFLIVRETRDYNFGKGERPNTGYRKNK